MRQGMRCLRTYRHQHIQSPCTSVTTTPTVCISPPNRAYLLLKLPRTSTARLTLFRGIGILVAQCCNIPPREQNSNAIISSDPTANISKGCLEAPGFVRDLQRGTCKANRSCAHMLPLSVAAGGFSREEKARRLCHRGSAASVRRRAG